MAYSFGEQQLLPSSALFLFVSGLMSMVGFPEKNQSGFKVKSLFLKHDMIKEQRQAPLFNFNSFWENETPFMYFERLPQNIDTSLFQYNLGDFVFTTFELKETANINNLYKLENTEFYVQLL